MKYTIATLALAAAILTGCAANAPAAPEVAPSPAGKPFSIGDIISPPPAPTWEPKTWEDLLIGPAAAGPVSDVDPHAPLIGPAAEAKEHHK